MTFLKRKGFLGSVGGQRGMPFGLGRWLSLALLSLVVQVVYGQGGSQQVPTEAQIGQMRMLAEAMREIDARIHFHTGTWETWVVQVANCGSVQGSFSMYAPGSPPLEWFERYRSYPSGIDEACVDDVIAEFTKLAFIRFQREIGAQGSGVRLWTNFLKEGREEPDASFDGSVDVASAWSGNAVYTSSDLVSATLNPSSITSSNYSTHIPTVLADAKKLVLFASPISDLGRTFNVDEYSKIRTGTGLGPPCESWRDSVVPGEIAANIQGLSGGFLPSDGWSYAVRKLAYGTYTCDDSRTHSADVANIHFSPEVSAIISKYAPSRVRIFQATQDRDFKQLDVVGPSQTTVVAEEAWQDAGSGSVEVGQAFKTSQVLNSGTLESVYNEFKTTIDCQMSTDGIFEACSCNDCGENGKYGQRGSRTRYAKLVATVEPEWQYRDTIVHGEEQCAVPSDSGGLPGFWDGLPGQLNGEGPGASLGDSAATASAPGLSLQLPGSAFNIAMRYASNSVPTGPQNGAPDDPREWMPSFPFVIEDGDPTPSGNSLPSGTMLDLHGVSSAGRHRRFYGGSSLLGTDFWEAGSGHWVARKDEASSFAIPVPLETTLYSTKLWRVSAPGSTTRYFFDSAEILLGEDPSLTGRIAAEVDTYGNQINYEYSTLSDGNVDKVHVYSPIRVYDTGTGTWMVEIRKVARVDLTWTGGRLAEAKAFRLTDNGTATPDETEVQNVAYTYKSTNDGWHDDYGIDGDLIQVVVGTLVDDNELSAVPAEQFYFQVTQYRYHRTVNANPISMDNGAVVLEGRDRQLKAVFEPRRLEYLADLYAAENSEVHSDARDFAEIMKHWGDSQVAGQGAGGSGAGAFGSFPSSSEWTVLSDTANRLVGYDSNGKLEVQFVDGASCGCGVGGAVQKSRFDYQRFTYDWDGEQGSTSRVIESADVDGDGASEPYRVHMYDARTLRGAGSQPFIVAQATAEIDLAQDTDGTLDGFDANGNLILGRVWAKLVERDVSSTLVTREGTYASTVYTPMQLTSGGLVMPPSVSFAPTGPVTVNAYNSENRKIMIGVADGGGPAAPTTTLLTTVYDDARSDLVKSVTNYPAGGSGAATVFTSYTFALDSNNEETDEVLWEKSSQLLDPESQNGPGGGATADTYRFFNEFGKIEWVRSPDGSWTYNEYDSVLGVITKAVRNADAQGTDPAVNPVFNASGRYRDLPGGLVGAPLAGGALVTTYEYDLLGRLVKTTEPTGRKTYLRRHVRLNGLAADGTIRSSGVARFAVLEFPHEVSSGPSVYDGAASISYFDAEGVAERISKYRLDTEVGYDPRDSVPTILDNNEVSRSTSEVSYGGQVVARRVWHDVSGGGVYTTSFEHDGLGRLRSVTDPEGGITQHFDGIESGYDIMDRVLLTAVGRNVPGGTPAVVSKAYYDSPLHAKIQGVGNGQLSLYVSSTGDSSGVVEYQTKNYYDWRDRRIGTERIAVDNNQVERLAEPAAIYELDNLGRQVASATFAVPFGGTLPSATAGVNTLSYTERQYSNRGHVYKEAIAIDPELPITTSVGGATASNVLETNTWFDAMGREVAVWAPSGPGRKMTYDGLGRVVSTYLTDRGGDRYPGASGNYADADPALSGLVGDRVLEQVNSSYDLSTGLLTYTVALMRRHDDLAMGALTETTAIPGYLAYLYDSAGRIIHAMNYGTNDAGGYVSPSSTFSFSPVISNIDDPTLFRVDNPSALVESVVFDARGRVGTVVDPVGRFSVTKYDDLDRKAAIVESADATFSVDDDIVWDAAATRWDIHSSKIPLPNDSNRVTSFVYDGNSAVVKQVAHQSDGSFQETRYVYGTTIGSSANDDDSLIASSSLLAEVHFPDEVTGVAGTSRSDKVLYAYDRFGSRRFMADQNETEHVYEHSYDASQNHTASDTVVRLGSGVDGAIRRLERVLDVQGRLLTAKSYDSAYGGSIVNAVQFEYDGIGNVESIIQDPTGDIDASDLSVDYTYAYLPPSSDGSGISEGNHVRVTAVQYPTDSSSTVTYGYGSASSIDDRISRVTSISELVSGVDLVNYDYAGTGMPVVVDYPVYDLKLARNIGLSSNTESTNGYPSLDQYGRVLRHAWISHSPSGNAGAAVDRRYSYNTNSSRLTNYDGTTTAVRDVGWEYEYDPLERLKQADRGRFEETATPQFQVSRGSERWVHDPLGNWIESYNDADGNGSFETTSETREYRSFTATNEIATARTDAWGGTAWAAVPGSSRPYTYDHAGNRTSDDAQGVLGDGAEPFVYTYDAWNRLVKAEREVDDTVNSVVTRHTLGEYEYNALTWRTRKRADTVDNGVYDTLDQQRTYYWSLSWQLLEEHVENDADGLFGPTNNDSSYKSRQFWGARYIDEAVAKRIDRFDDGFTAGDERFFYLTDAQYSVVALLDDDEHQGIVERIDYTSYGEVRRRSSVDSRTSPPASGNDVFYPDNIFDLTDIGAFTDSFSNNLADGDLGVPFGQWDLTDTNQFSDMWGLADAVPDGWLSDPRDVAITGSGSDNSVGYSGYLFDPEIQLYAVRNRCYDPESGRWLQVDPAGYIDGFNRHEYVNGKPVQYSDPMGLWWITLNLPATPSKCQTLYRVMNTYALTTRINGWLWRHYLGGTGRDLKLRMSDFDEGGWDRRDLVGEIIDYEEQFVCWMSNRMACGASRKGSSGYMAKGYQSFPNSMINMYTLRADYDNTDIEKVCFAGVYCYTKATFEVDFTATDRTDFNVGAAFNLPPYVIHDALIIACGVGKPFDIQATMWEEHVKRYRCK